MRTVVDSGLRREARAFELKYSCPDCAHFDPARVACAEGYPNDSHREGVIPSEDVVVFCKSFELL